MTTDVNTAVRNRLEDFVENALDPQAAATGCLGALELHQPIAARGMVLCEGCSPVRDRYTDGTPLKRYMLMPWPCATWKVIATAVVGEVAVEMECKRIRDLEC